MSSGNLPLYFYLLTRFRNGWSLIQNLRHGGWLAGGPTCARIVQWDGTELEHPPNVGGFVGSLAELWHEQCYTRHGFYEPHAGDVILNLGAHVGLFSIFIARRNPACRVVALEPSENYDYLVRNLAAANVHNVETHRLAVGATRGWVRMIHSTLRSIENRAVFASADDATSVEAVPLAAVLDLARTDRVAFLKMDIEGSEVDAMSATDTATLRRIERMGIGYHDHLVPGTLKQLQEVLAATHDTRIEPAHNGHGRLFATRWS